MSRPSRGLDRQVTVKLTAAQVEKFKSEAARRGITLADLIREKLGVHRPQKGESAS